MGDTNLGRMVQEPARNIIIQSIFLSRKGSQKQCKLADSTKLTFNREKIQMGLNKSQYRYQINSSVAKQQEPKTA